MMASVSTKVSICHGDRFHLYRDALDEELGEAAPVYLTLRDVEFECQRTEQGSEVTVSLPREVARSLGLPLTGNRADG